MTALTLAPTCWLSVALTLSIIFGSFHTTSAQIDSRQTRASWMRAQVWTSSCWLACLFIFVRCCNSSEQQTLTRNLSLYARVQSQVGAVQAASLAVPLPGPTGKLPESRPHLAIMSHFSPLRHTCQTASDVANALCLRLCADALQT